MAIIQCPKCNKRISDKGASCSHCGYFIEGQSLESLQRQAYDLRASKLSKLQMYQLLSMIVLVLGMALGAYDWHEEGVPELLQSVLTASSLKLVGFCLMAVAFAGYIGVRVKIYQLKR